jgi:lysozyme
MSIVVRDQIASELLADESFRAFVYDDATGKPITEGSVLIGNPTIGIGRCLNKKGITKAEAEILLSNDLDEITADLSKLLPVFATLDEPRSRVLVEMAFNMGVTNLLGFRDMLSAIEQEDYQSASVHMLDSTWAKQVGARAVRLAELMKSAKHA